jgi:hypothetical protein
MKTFRLRLNHRFSRISTAEKTTSEAEKAKLDEDQEEQTLEEQHTAAQEAQIEQEEEEADHIESETTRGMENELSAPEEALPSANKKTSPTTSRNAYRARGNGRRKKRNRS